MITPKTTAIANSSLNVHSNHVGKWRKLKVCGRYGVGPQTYIFIGEFRSLWGRCVHGSQVRDTRSHRLWLRKTAAAIGWQRQDGEMFTAASRPGLGQKSGLGKGSGALQDTAPSQLRRLPSSPADSRPSELESSLGEGWDLPLNLTLCLMTTILLTVDWMGPLMSFTDSWLLVGGAHCGTDQWLSRTTNRHSLANPHLGEGPTVVLTNGWAGPLTVTLWQLLTWGRGPPWCWQWLSRTTKGPHH